MFTRRIRAPQNKYKKHALHCHRRIQGAIVEDDKVYAVYLVKTIPRRNPDWICGGAIVTEWFIVTSAACVQNVTFMYAVAGYKKFVDADDLEKDECTKRTKKKIVFSCVPKAYEFEFQPLEKWTHVDIAVIKVESKYDFTDNSYLQYCSYIPGPIKINFEEKYQLPGRDTIALGWGHTERFIFKDSNHTKYNQRSLMYSPFVLAPKEVCKEAYKHYSDKSNIDKYMLCAEDVGNIDDTGDTINKNVPKVIGCVSKKQKLKGLRGISCEEPDLYQDYYDNNDRARRDLSETSFEEDENVSKAQTTTRKIYQMLKPPQKSTNSYHNKKSDDETNDKLSDKHKYYVDRQKPDYYTYYESDDNNTSDNETYDELEDENKNIERSFNSSIGICQNDHGGPLVTWRGAREILIGVITMFIVTKESLCKGPYLFTSTQCNSAFLDCVINYATKNDSTRKLCDNPNEIGFEMIRRHISWANHPSGAAENENLQGRQQISIQQYHIGNAVKKTINGTK